MVSLVNTAVLVLLGGLSNSRFQDNKRIHGYGKPEAELLIPLLEEEQGTGIVTFLVPP